MKKIIFKNRKGKELKTTMSDDITNQVANIVELELKRRDIFYLREDTNFKVKQDNIKTLLDAQKKAVEKLIKDNTITLDMVKKDVMFNY